MEASGSALGREFHLAIVVAEARCICAHCGCGDFHTGCHLHTHGFRTTVFVCDRQLVGAWCEIRHRRLRGGFSVKCVGVHALTSFRSPRHLTVSAAKARFRHGHGVHVDGRRTNHHFLFHRGCATVDILGGHGVRASCHHQRAGCVVLAIHRVLDGGRRCPTESLQVNLAIRRVGTRRIHHTGFGLEADVDFRRGGDGHCIRLTETSVAVYSVNAQGLTSRQARPLGLCGELRRVVGDVVFVHPGTTRSLNDGQHRILSVVARNPGSQHGIYFHQFSDRNLHVERVRASCGVHHVNRVHARDK